MICRRATLRNAAWDVNTRLVEENPDQLSIEILENTKNKLSFPKNEALMKFIYLAGIFIIRVLEKTIEGRSENGTYMNSLKAL